MKAHFDAYAAADALYKKRQYRRALIRFRRALALAPDDSETLWAIGDCYSELKRPRMAERTYKKALRYSSSKHRAALRYNIGNALFDQRRYSEAIRYYRQVPTKAARKNMATAKSRLLTTRPKPTRAKPARAVRRER